ncbi:hypothetical protein P7H20_25670 [Paenibacillus larvae]|nr:hypothetical protein [Paenibacillus larvae]MDT2277555.1 hypothetical protein [Paenibacillus larvae]
MVNAAPVSPGVAVPKIHVANPQDNEIPLTDGTRLSIQRGQHMTSVRSIATGVGWYEGVLWKEPNPKSVSVVLDWLVKNGMIHIERGKSRQYTLITILNYEIYQENEEKDIAKPLE